MASIHVVVAGYVSPKDAQLLIAGGGVEFPEFTELPTEERINEIAAVAADPGTVSVQLRSGSEKGPLVGLALVSLDNDWNVGLCASVIVNTVLPAYRAQGQTFSREVFAQAVKMAEAKGAKWVAWSHRDKSSGKTRIRYVNTYMRTPDVRRHILKEKRK